MFNEMHASSTENGINLAFIKSANVQAFPCGRRRSELVEKDGDSNTVDDKYYIPFDPEARLNTETNNRKHSGLNGFSQTYIKNWDVDNLSLVLSGYLFDIKLDAGYQTPADFVTKLATALQETDFSSIYANILIEETPLFAGFKDYSTWVLRDQAKNETASVSLDLLSTAVKEDTKSLTEIQDPENYYFSGLSFSTQPRTGDLEATYSSLPIGTVHTRSQLLVSLHILEKDTNGDWQIYLPALLPKIEHGSTEGSVKVKSISTEHIELISTNAGGTTSVSSVPSLDVVESSPGIYQLQFKR